MSITILMLLSYILTFILIVVIISLLLRIKDIEKRLVNFTPTEAYTIMESMRYMIMESERVADNLDNAIKIREATLEDLVDLVDAKLSRLDTIVSSNIHERSNTAKIYEMYGKGIDEIAIARELGISVSEVNMVVNLSKQR